MSNEPRYTAEQISTAARELYDAAGSDEETMTTAESAQTRFTTGEAIIRLSEEIRLLRERGFDDTQIAGLLSGFDIEVTPEELTHYAPANR